MHKTVSKIISIMLAAGILFSVSGCGPTGKLADKPGVEIANNNGQYTYTLYGDIKLTMDLYVNDYISTNNSGNNIFKISQMAYDLGWAGSDKYTEIDNNNSDTYRVDFYTFTNGDMVTRVDIGVFDEAHQFTDSFSNHQIQSINVSHLKDTDALDTAYYTDSDPLHINMNCQFQKHYDACAIFAVGNGTAMNYADIVILSYILWSEANGTGTNALVSALGTSSQYVTSTKSDVITLKFY